MALISTSFAALLNLAPGPWEIVNDGVMGGRSTSRAETLGDGLRFHGHLSLENNGGFASTRRSVEGVAPDTVAVRLDVRGDGRRYQLRLRQDRRPDSVAWRSAFDTREDWTEIELPLSDFEPVFRGRLVPDAGAIQPAAITQLGFMIADGNPGAFALDVRRLAFVGRDD
jgi:monofunctional biosynthetic peptidoglycan transglycosylase